MIRILLARAPEGLENLALHAQQPGFDRGRPTKSPEQGCEAMHELPLDGVCGRYSDTSKTRYSSGSSRGSMTVSAVSACLSTFLILLGRIASLSVRSWR